MQRLPLGIQTFSELRNGDYLYVDKTEVIHRLITSGKPFFLARPRRFGKSLLVSTLAEIFRGNKQFFEGLAIYDKWDWSKKHPVIHIDWSIASFSTVDELKRGYKEIILRIARNYGVAVAPENPSIYNLSEALYRKYNEQVAVLIDEYDKPLHEAIVADDKNLFGQVKQFLHEVYTPLKSCDPYLKFLFLTGISKYAGISIFSTLNNLTDISLDERYSTICGYTQEELESNFKEHIDALTLSRTPPQSREQILASIKKWYNGYSWDGKTSLYNPLSTLLLFDTKDFENYWFTTATPSFLLKILAKKKRLGIALGETVVRSLVSTTDDPYKIAEETLFFQTGYLTIKEIRQTPEGGKLFALDFPNREVRESFSRSLLAEYGQYDENKSDILREKLEAQLLASDSVALSATLRSLLAWIPYKLIIQREFYYHSILLLWLRLLGFNITAEVSTNLGIIDAVWELNDQIFVAEIKYAKPSKIKDPSKGKKPANNKNTLTARSVKALDKLLAAAFVQIEEKRYPERYKTENKKIKALAIACSGREVKCEIREIEEVKEI
ncbi:MAG: ATP-binding protein [Puniceicoccales bacterium]|nr:ATP-binding protein [Puniceicoccales bacterium]